ncbi:MAG: MBL fold hydrolase [bacterium]|nr:MAG: MBL fold hydrolase [bacterium]
MPLVSEDGSPFDFKESGRQPSDLLKDGILPTIKGFYKDEKPEVEALIISHPHQDHYGFAGYVNLEIPVLIGEAACNILKAASIFMPIGIDFKNIVFLKDRQRITIGPFEITPFLADHSAYDAYSLLVSADGKTLFYSGDFRGHGRKAALFHKLIRQPPKDVDVLLLEGSVIGRTNGDKGFQTEEELVQDYINHINSTSGLCLIWSSGQNIDRIVTIFKAARKACRQLIIDLYTAEILRATGNDKIPQGDWEGVRVFIPYFQRVKIKREEKFELLEPYKSKRIFPENLAKEASQSVMLFRPSMCNDLEDAGCLQESSLIYSLWDGYLKQDRQIPFREWLDRNNIPLKKIHTSGHASVSDLQKLAKAIIPKHLIPIHTFERDMYESLFENVHLIDDGEVFEV